MATIARTNGYFDGARGLRIHYLTWEVPQPRAGIVIVHGIGEHAGRYARLADDLAGWGYSCFALDQRGHGMSEGRRGHVQRFDHYLQDVDQFRRLVAGVLPARCPLFLLGQSLGGLVVLRYLQTYDPPLRGGVVCSPWITQTVAVPRWKLVVAPLLDRLLPAMPFATGLNVAHISHDPAVVRAYRDDRLVHSRITPRQFGETSRAVSEVVRGVERLRVPLLFLLGGDDRTVSTPATLALTEAIGAERASTHVFPGFYHEVLNERERDRPLAVLREWLAVQLS